MSHNLNKGLGLLDFQIVRNEIDFKKFVDDNIEEISLVSFDHDLGDWVEGDGKEFTGKDACEYLIDKCLDKCRKFPDWYVHSDNTCGRDNIIGSILSYIKTVDNIDISGFRYYHKGYVNGKFV